MSVTKLPLRAAVVLSRIDGMVAAFGPFDTEIDARWYAKQLPNAVMIPLHEPMPGWKEERDQIIKEVSGVS